MSAVDTSYSFKELLHLIQIEMRRKLSALSVQDGSLFSVILIPQLSIYPSAWCFGASHIAVQKAMSQKYVDAINTSLILSLVLQEQLRITEAAEKAKQEDARVLEAKKAAGAALLRDVMAGNAAMIERKKDEKIREILEEQRIAAFVKERDAKAQVCLAISHARSVAPDLQSSRQNELRSQQDGSKLLRIWSRSKVASACFG